MTKEQMENIIQENMQKIYLYCVKKLENTAVAEDVASDIILELLRSYTRIKNDDAVYGYMWSVANNLCKNYWRRSEKETYAEIPDDFVGTYCFSPEESYVREEEIMLLRRELSLLREKYRRIMISYYIKGNTCEEIADKYNLSVSNVKQCLFEGRKKLKEGMDMVREYGELSYAPEKFTMNFWGNSSYGYWELFERKLPGNLIIAAYENPKTLEELSLEMGVSVPYLEDEVAILEKMGLLVRKGKTYQSNMVLYDEQWRKTVYEKATELLHTKLEDVKKLVDEGVEYLAETDYCYEASDINVRRWFILLLIIWEASMMSEQKMNTKMTFPLLQNGSNGYVMGIRGEYHTDIKGIYGQYDMSKGHMRIMNFVKLSDKVLNPFGYGNSVGQMLEGAVERKQEPEEVAALSILLENGFVSVKNGSLCPEFATISYEDYKAVKDKLSEGIDRMAEMIGKHRDMAGEELRKKTPVAIQGANEVGAIVSMWSMLEGMVAVMLEDGYMAKGKGQNLTAFYFKTENE
ncbi:MAG: sigma-70 family RNA polymerase sigma factor [Lachnospiraceae bacterium]|nr:sigma-70 family RNA polymerase sigma factor [Lachnospiraceae bacterium]